MAELTRRGFIVNTSLLGAAAGTAAAVPLIGKTDVVRPDDIRPESLVVHVKDLDSSVVSMMIGTEEVVYKDAALVDQLLATAKRHVRR